MRDSFSVFDGGGALDVAALLLVRIRLVVVWCGEGGAHGGMGSGSGDEFLNGQGETQHGLLEALLEFGNGLEVGFDPFEALFWRE